MAEANRRLLPLKTFLLRNALWVCMISAALSGLGIAVYARAMVLQKADTQLFTAAEFLHELLGSDYHDSITGADSVSVQQYGRGLDRNDDLCRRLGLQYLWSVLVVDDRIVFTTATRAEHGNPSAAYAAFFETHSDPAAFDPAMGTSGVPVFSSFRNEWGEGRMVLVPRLDQHGRRYILGASIQLTELNALLARTIGLVLLLAVAIFGIVWVLARGWANSLIGLFSRINESARRMTAGDLDAVLPESTIDDMRQLVMTLDQLRLEIKRRIDELKTSEDRLNLAVAGTGAGLWDWDVVNDRIYFSPLWKSLLGYTEHEVENSFDGWRGLWHPDEADAVAAAIADHRAGKTDRFEIEQRLRHKNGEWRWILVRGDMVRSDMGGERLGAPTRWVGTIIDVTDRKRVGLELQRQAGLITSLLDSIPDIVFFKDIEGVYLGCNPPFAELAGRDRDDIVGQRDDQIFGPEQAAQFRAQDREAVDCMEAVHDEFWVTYPDGRRVLIDVLKTPYRGQDGSLLGVLAIGRDITELKNAEASILRSYRLLGDLSAQLPGVIYQYRYYPDGRNCFPYASDHIRHIYEVTPQEVEHDGSKVLERIHPDDRDSVIAKIRRSFYALELWEDDYRVQLPQRGERWLRGTAMPTRLDDGSVLWHGYVTDITERKGEEERIRRSEQQAAAISTRLSLATKAGGVGVWDFDIVHDRLEWDDEMFALYGLRRDSFGAAYDTWRSGLHPDDVERCDREIARAINGEADFNSEFRVVHPDGSVRYIRALAVVLREADGRPQRMIGTNWDITANKQAEEQLKRVTLLLNDAQRIAKLGAWQMDVASGKTIWTDEVYRIHEVDSDFDHNKANGIEFYHPDYQPIIVRAMDDALNRQLAFDEICRFRTAKGNELWVRASGYPIVQDGMVTQLVGMFQDITEQMRIETELRSATEQAETANKAKSEFLANMSHEIRTPLNAVLGFTELLKATPLNPLQQQYVTSAHVSGQSLLNIINDILDFSKIEAGMMVLEQVKTDMVRLIRDCVDVVSVSAGHKKLELLLDVAAHAPRFAHVDPTRLKQVLSNLLSNAVKFTERGEVELQVQFIAQTEHRGEFTFAVRDTGIGIPETQKAKLFKAFSQADSSTTRRFGGTGLGLIISNLIVDKMGGKIQFESTEGAGSRFFFAVEAETENGPPEDDVELSDIHRCLIIDDNESNRIILERMLQQRNIAARSVANGLDALKALSDQGPFDAVVCDYHMPYLDGLETIRMIRDNLAMSPEKQPIVLLHSSSDDVTVHQKCEQYAVRCCLTKPVTAEQLYRCLAKAVRPPVTGTAAVSSAGDSPIADGASTGGAGFAAAEPVVPPADVARGAASPTRPATILVVEDVPTNMLLITAFLQQIAPAAVVIEAANGNEALAVLDRERPDLVLMDVQMPVTDGLQATARIRAAERAGDRRLPIVALTAGALQEEREKCIAAGMDDFLTKPIEPQKLADVVRRFLTAAGDEPAAGAAQRIPAVAPPDSEVVHFDAAAFRAACAQIGIAPQSLARIFLRDCPGRIADLQTAIDAQDAEPTRLHARALKDMATNLSLPAMADYAAQIEQEIGAAGDWQVIGAAYAALRAEWDAVQTLLNEI